MREFKITLLLFQGQIGHCTYYGAPTLGDNQLKIELKQHHYFNSILKVEEITENETRAVYTNNELIKELDLARVELQRQQVEE